MDVEDKNGDTPLLLASRAHAHEAVGELLRLGANPRHTNKLGRTALHKVCQDGDLYAGGLGKTVMLLVPAGCPPEARDKRRRTAEAIIPDTYVGAKFAFRYSYWVSVAKGETEFEGIDSDD